MRRNGRRANKASRRRKRVHNAAALQVLAGRMPGNGRYGPRITITMDRTVNLGGYSNSAKVGMIVSSVAAGTTDTEIDDLLVTGKVVYDKMRLELYERLKDAREAAKHPY